jgi:putative sporulation protein YtaF
MSWFALLFISISISLDGFSVGITYGLRQLRIPISSLSVIALCSFSAVYAVMSASHSLVEWISPETGKKLGGSILVLIGCITLIRMKRAKGKSISTAPVPSQPEQPISQIRAFGLIIQILRDPSTADADRSGHITGWEAVMLGVALSFDAMGAGISFVFLGYPRLTASGCVAFSGAALLALGIEAGQRFRTFRWFQDLSWLPPVLLICIGVVKGIL